MLTPKSTVPIDGLVTITRIFYACDGVLPWESCFLQFRVIDTGEVVTYVGDSAENAVSTLHLHEAMSVSFTGFYRPATMRVSRCTLMTNGYQSVGTSTRPRKNCKKHQKTP